MSSGDRVKISTSTAFPGVVRDGLLILAVFLFYLLLVFQFNFLADDAFISFRYADNLVEGFGLRYNPTEQPPVEGYSNFLWVLILAGFMKLGMAPMFASRLLSILCGLALLAAVYISCRRWLKLDRFKSFLGTLSLALFPPFFVWSTSGMETVPFTLSIFLLLITLLGSKDKISTPIVGLAGLTVMLLRPEGMGYALIIPLCAAAYYFLTKKDRRWIKELGQYFAIILLGLIALTVWRLVYFDSLLPNTFYAKVGLTHSQWTRGLYYVVHFLLTFTGSALVLVGSIAALFVGARHKVLYPIILFLFFLLLIPVILGGDFMAMARFLVPAAPIFSLLLAKVLCPSFNTLRQRRGMLLLLVTMAAITMNVLPAYNLHSTPTAWRKAVHFRWNIPEYMSESATWERTKLNTELWTLLGQSLATVASQSQSMVIGAIGAKGYYSKLHVYDKNGLVTRDVREAAAMQGRSSGHDRALPFSYFLKYEPDYIAVNLVPQERIPTWRRQLESIHRTFPPQYYSEYSFYTIPLKEEFRGQNMFIVALKRVATPQHRSSQTTNPP
jgi:arabinofuranosyltransferase